MEYGWMLLRMIAVLGAVCALAYVSLRWGLQRYVKSQPGSRGRMEVVDRLGIGPRRSLLVVRAGEQFWLVGSSESGLAMLGELEADNWQLSEESEALDGAQELASADP